MALSSATPVALRTVVLEKYKVKNDFIASCRLGERH